MATVSLDDLHTRTLPKRLEIASRLKEAHAAARVNGNPAVSDAIDALHSVIADGDDELRHIINGDGQKRAKPLDGGGAGKAPPPNNG